MNLYQKLGKEEGWYDILYHLYCELIDHPEIAHHFLGVDIEKLSQKQTQYLCSAFGSPKPYTGRDLKIVHKDMGITPFQFKVVVDQIEYILKMKGVDSADSKVIVRVFKAHRGIVVTAKRSIYDQILIPWYRFVYKVESYFKKLAFKQS